MKSLSLKAFPRTLTGRNGVNKVRSQGRIPAVIYGTRQSPRNLEIEGKDLDQLIKHSVSENLLVDLTIDQDAGAAHLALLQDIQHNPLSGKVVHVDLHEVDPNEPVVVQVPLETVGEPVGVKTGGGTLEHVVFKIRVRALPRNLPEFISVDVSGLEVGKSLHLGEIPLPEGVEVLGDKTIPVAAVAIPRAEAETEAATEIVAGAPAGTVEMIKEKKDVPAGAAAAAAPAKTAAPAKSAPAKK